MTVISLHAKSKAFNGAQNAERILQWMVGLHEKRRQNSSQNSVRPTYVHFLTVMIAYTKRRVKGAAEKVERLLVQMEDLYQLGNEEVKPNLKVSAMQIFLL